MLTPNASAPSSRFADEEEKEEAPGGIKNSRQVDKHYFDSRIVMVTGEISHTLAERVCVNLFALAQAGNDPITVIISSPGGHVESGDMIHDMIKFVKPRVRMLATGWAASAGSLIFAAADRADRYSLPNTRFLLHEPRGGVGGAASDVAIQAREILRMRERLNKIYAAATGQTLERIKADTDRDYWMTAEEARDYGLVGSIITTMDQLK